jgi:hypothetical protein
MADTNFIGFYYIEGDPDGPIKNSQDYTSDISNYPNQEPNITFLDVINKFTKPVTLSNAQGLVVQKMIIENFGLVGTIDDRTSINPLSDGWDRVFNICNYIYHNASGKTSAEIDGIISGSITVPGLSVEPFKGFVRDSCILQFRTDIPSKLEKFRFIFTPAEGLDPRYIEMYVNPEGFYVKYKTVSPIIYVWYTTDTSIDPGEQKPVVMDEVFENIGKNIMNEYRLMSVPIWGIESIERQPFHIFTKNIVIPSDPLSDYRFADAIKYAIMAREPELTDEQQKEKYPTIFIDEGRILYPLFDNVTLKRYQITDQQTGNPVDYMSNPVSYAWLKMIIESTPILQGDVAAGYGILAWELFTSAHTWIPIIAAGRTGALTDKIPKYRPLLEDMGTANTEDAYARTFYTCLDKVLNYILGRNTINALEKNDMGFYETSAYVSFKVRGINWQVYKRGYTTNFDEQG